MRTILRGTLQDFEIRAGQDLQPGDGARHFSDAHSALHFLRGFVHDPFAMATLRKAIATSLWHAPLFNYSDHQVLQQLAWQLASGRLGVVPLKRILRLPAGGARRPTQREEPPADAPVQPSPAPPQGPITPPPEEQVTTHWITFQLLDDDTEAPIANVDLRLKLPDGAVSIYTTNSDGVVHLPDLPAGTCDLEKMLDEEAYEIAVFE